MSNYAVITTLVPDTIDGYNSADLLELLFARAPKSYQTDGGLLVVMTGEARYPLTQKEKTRKLEQLKKARGHHSRQVAQLAAQIERDHTPNSYEVTRNQAARRIGKLLYADECIQDRVGAPKPEVIVERVEVEVAPRLQYDNVKIVDHPPYDQPYTAQDYFLAHGRPFPGTVPLTAEQIAERDRPAYDPYENAW